MANQPLEEDIDYLEDTTGKPTSAHFQARKQKDVPQYLKRHGLISKYTVSHIGQPDQESNGLETDDQILPNVSGSLWTHRRGNQWSHSHGGSGVQYSLNKKKRWEMGDFIKDNLESLNEADGVQVSLVKGEQRLPVNQKQLQVTEYHTVEDGQHVHRIPNLNYANYESLTCKQAPQRGRGRKGQRPDPAAIEEYDNPPDSDDIHIRYEIVEGAKSRNLYEYYRQKQCKSSNPMQTVRKIENLMDDRPGAFDNSQWIDYCYLYGYDDEEDEYYSAPENGECEETGLSPNLRSGSLLDFLAVPVQSNVERKSERKARLSLKVSAENNSEDHKKSHVVYIGTHKTPSPSIFTGDSPFSRAPMKFSQKTYFNLVPTLVRIPKVELASQWLVDRFGDAYLECAVLQRRFFIDISAETRKKLEASYGEEFMDKQNFSALCIFEVMKVSGVQSDESVPVRVYLNADLCDEVLSLSCNTLQPDALVSVSEVLEAAVKAFELLPLDNYCSGKEHEQICPVAAKATHPNPLLPTAVTTYTDEHSKEAILRVDNHIKHLQRQLTAVMNFEEEALPIDVFELADDCEQLCGICFAAVDVLHSGQEITANSATLAGGSSLMALAQCQHWFCQDCWTIHISTAIQSGQIPVRCPEYDCKAMLDFDTLRSVVALPLCRMYAAQLRDTFIQKHGKEWKWCPNKHCGRVVHVQEGDLEPASILACYCGYTWCPECAEVPHWPATCQQSADHVNRLTKDGHLSTVEPTTHVMVKECPFCHLKMERSQGCNHMSCRCGQSFCWACAKPFGGNFSHDNCDTDLLKNKKSFQRVQLIDVAKKEKEKLEDEWYRTCVKHRLARFPAKMRPLRKLLESQLSSYKQCWLLLGESKRFETSKKPSMEGSRMSHFHATKKRVWTSLSQAHQFAENSLVWFHNTPGLNKKQKQSFINCIDRLNDLIQIIEQDITNKKINRLMENLNGMEARTMDLINLVKGLKRVKESEAGDGAMNNINDRKEPSTSAGGT